MKLLSILIKILVSLLIVVVIDVNAQQAQQPIFKTKLKEIQRASDLLLGIVSFEAKKQSDTWYWYTTLKNKSNKRSIPRGRMHIKVEQIVNIPFQSFSAGEFDFTNNLSPNGKQSITFRWNKKKNTNRLKITAIDLKTRQVLATRTIQLPKTGYIDNPSTSQQPKGMEKEAKKIDIHKEIEVVGSRYLGNGKSTIQIKNTGTVPIDSGDYTFTYEPDVFGVRTSEYYLSVKKGVVPAIGYGQFITIVGSSSLGYECITFKSINLKFTRTSDSAQFSHKIHVIPPDVTIDEVKLVTYEDNRKLTMEVVLGNNDDRYINLIVRARVGGFSNHTPIQNFIFESRVELKKGIPKATTTLVENFAQLFKPDFKEVSWQSRYLKADISVILGGNSLCTVEAILDRKFWMWNQQYEQAGISTKPKNPPVRWWGW